MLKGVDKKWNTANIPSFRKSVIGGVNIRSLASNPTVFTIVYKIMMCIKS